MDAKIKCETKECLYNTDGNCMNKDTYNQHKNSAYVSLSDCDNYTYDIRRDDVIYKDRQWL